MSEYHIYFGDGDRLRKMVDIDAADDALAIIEAEHVLVEAKQEAVEVWRGTRLISRLSLSKPAGSTTTPP